MPKDIVALLANKFTFTSRDREIMHKTTRELSRSQRNYYFRELKPREREFKEYLKQITCQFGTAELENVVISNLLSRRGDPTIADSLLMDVLGRLEIYRKLRERAGQEGVKLRALNNFGGVGLVIALVGIITGLIMYLTAR